MLLLLFKLLPRAPPYYSISRGKIHTWGNIWTYVWLLFVFQPTLSAGSGFPTPSWSVQYISVSYNLTQKRKPLLWCYQNGAKPGFETLFGPSMLGAGAKTRHEAAI